MVIVKIIVFVILLLFSNVVSTNNAIVNNKDDNKTEDNIKDSRSYLEKALSLAKTGDTQAAILCLNSAIRLDPKYVDAYIARASILEKNGNLQSALIDYTHALNIKPYDKLFYNRGVIELALKAFAEAARDFTSAIELNPQFARAYSDRGIAFLANNMLEEAKNDFIQAFHLNNNILFALEKTGEINLKQGNFIEALKNFDQLLQIDKNNANGYLHRAKVYEALKMPEQALKDYNTGVNLSNNNSPTDNTTPNSNILDHQTDSQMKSDSI